MLEQSELVIDGVRTPMLIGGPQHAHDVILFLHDNPGRGTDLQELAVRAALHGRVLAPDLPGFGAAAKPGDFNYSAAGYARHIAILLEQLDVVRVHVVAHGFGAIYALEWASEWPEMLGSIVLFSAGFMPGYRWPWMARLWRRRMVPDPPLSLVNRATFRWANRHAHRGNLPKDFRRGWLDNVDEDTREIVFQLYRATDPAVMSTRWKQALAPARAPALVIWGNDDPFVDVSFAERQLEVFPNAQVHVLEQCGHWPFIEQADDVAELVLPFLVTALSRSV